MRACAHATVYVPTDATFRQMPPDDNSFRLIGISPVQQRYRHCTAGEIGAPASLSFGAGARMMIAPLHISKFPADATSFMMLHDSASRASPPMRLRGARIISRTIELARAFVPMAFSECFLYRQRRMVVFRPAYRHFRHRKHGRGISLCASHNVRHVPAATKTVSDVAPFLSRAASCHRARSADAAGILRLFTPHA